MAAFMQKLEYCASTKVRVKKCLQRDRGLGKTQNQCLCVSSLPLYQTQQKECTCGPYLRVGVSNKDKTGITFQEYLVSLT